MAGWFTAAAAAAAVTSAQSAMPSAPSDGAQDAGAVPAALRGLEVEQLIGNQVPMDAPLTDSDGQVTTLGELFKPGQPVLLNLGYYECPMLCPLVHAGIVDAARSADWKIGKDYQIVSISIDPAETPTVARSAKRQVMLQLDRGGDDSDEELAADEAGWHFLVGDEATVKQITEAAGFGFRYLPKQDEYAHGAVIVFLSPDGVVTSYLNGTRYAPQQFELALVDAGQGTAGSPFEQLIAWCYHFSASDGKYVIMAQRVMSIFGAASVLALGGTIGGLFWWEHRRRLRFEAESADGTATTASPPPAPPDASA